MLDLEAIKAREKAANEYAADCVGLDAEDWIVHGYGARSMRKDFVALIAEVERLRSQMEIREQMSFALGVETLRPIFSCKSCGYLNRPFVKFPSKQLEDNDR